MVFSIDETANKALVCAGVPEQCKQIEVLEWIGEALKPLKGKGGGGKGGVAQGQVSNFPIVTNLSLMANSEVYHPLESYACSISDRPQTRNVPSWIDRRARIPSGDPTQTNPCSFSSNVFPV